MATSPSDSEKPVMPAPTGPAAPVLKNPVIAPKPGAPSSVSGRRPSGGAGMDADRAALGLSSLKPSEMIAGLDAAAKRAEKMDAREAEKRKSGGRLNQTTALHVDDTGSRWSRTVNRALIGIVVVGLGGWLGLTYLANRKLRDPREMSAESRKMLSEYVVLSQRMQSFDAGQQVTAEMAKTRILETIDASIAVLDTEIAREKEQRKQYMDKDIKNKHGRRLDKNLFKDREWLDKLRQFKDAKGQPYDFTMADDGMLKISPQQIVKTETLEPVTMRVQASAPAK